MPGTPVFVDTNIFIRFLTGDPPGMAEECRAFITAAESGDFELHASHLAMAEIVWTLDKHYDEPREDIAAALRDILALRSFRIEAKEMVRNAIDLYASTNVDFIDAYQALECADRRVERLCSYDHDFEALPIRRVEPAALLADR